MAPVMTAQAPSTPADRDIRAGTFWRHYKGTLYEVIGIGHHTELRVPVGMHTQPEPHVMYKEVKEGDKEPDTRIWLRPCSMWLEQVETQHYHSSELDQGVQKPTVQRFTHEPLSQRRGDAMRSG